MRQPSNLTFRDRTGRRGFPQREWHRLHKAFQRATLHTTLCSVADSSKRLWINCGGCERNEYVETHEWAVRHKVDFPDFAHQSAVALLQMRRTQSDPIGALRQFERFDVKVDAKPATSETSPRDHGSRHRVAKTFLCMIDN